MYEKLHEILIVEYSCHDGSELRSFCKTVREMGFVAHDDVYSFDRKDACPPWQHPSIVECATFYNGREVFGKRGKWDRIQLSYLFATLPEECCEIFIEVVNAMSAALGINPTHDGSNIDDVGLRRIMAVYKEEIVSTYGMLPGSEELGILIQSTYPRMKVD